MSIQVESQCLLHYAFQESPNGLRCSLDNVHTQLETLELTISNTRLQNVYVTKIVISFPLGADLANTFSSGSNITFTTQHIDDFNVVQQSPGVFVFTPKSGNQVTFLNQGLYLRFSDIVMNTTPGVVKVHITETSKLNSGASTANTTGWIWFGKYPYQFFMRNFAADKVIVNAGESVTLSWVGAYNGNFTLNWSDAQGAQSADVTNVRVWKSPPLQQSTIFQLVGVSVDGNRTTHQLETGVMVQPPR